jgi:polyphosphate kinase
MVGKIEYLMSNYINREISILEFNSRVLSKAKDKSVPILERLRFLCICSANLDEFFGVRVAALKEMERVDGLLTSPDNLNPTEVLADINRLAHQIIHDQYKVLNEDLIPELDRHNIHITHRDEWTAEQRTWAKDYFEKNLAPILSPMGVDPAHPFPQVENLSLHFIITLEGKDAFGRSIKHAVLQIPRSLPRVIEIPDVVSTYKHQFVFLSTIVHAHIDHIFPGMEVTGCYQFRLTRNTNLILEEETTRDLLPTIQNELLTRSYGNTVRLEVSDQASQEVTEYLLKRFNLSEDELYQVNGPVNLYRLSSMNTLINEPDLFFPKFRQRIPRALLKSRAKKKGQRVESIFNCIKKEKQILIHHPYHSFYPVLELLRQGAEDPSVLAIRMTLYRTGEKSEIVDYLEMAARKGKEVTVVVELKARFDESTNILVAKRLQRAGAKVVYGVLEYKTHAKMLLLVKKERNKLSYFYHLGTGNYHSITNKYYTDFGILSNDQSVGEDIHKIFQQLTSLVSTKGLKKLLQAPFTLKAGFIEKINREIEIAKTGKEAKILAKMNGLQEPEVIDKLYEASQSGVEIKLIVRGICSLRPGVKGLSENIIVRSVLGRFLEHSRIYYFHNDGESELWCSSADLMSRNLNKRVEIAFPIENQKLKDRVIRQGLEYYLDSEIEAWDLNSDGTYNYTCSDHKDCISIQNILIEEYKSKQRYPG